MTNANGAIVEDKIIHPFMWMKTKPGGGMKSLKCTITSVPTDELKKQWKQVEHDDPILQHFHLKNVEVGT